MMLKDSFQADFIGNSYAEVYNGAIFIAADITTGSSECVELNPFSGRCGSVARVLVK